MALSRFLTITSVCLACIVLTSCATFTRTELQTLGQRGVPAQLVARLDERRPLTPPELVDLTRGGVPDRYIARHLEGRGVDYVVTRPDIVRLRKAGVRALVVDTLLRESDRFAAGYATRESVYYHGNGYEGDPWYDSGWGLGVGVASF
ncbi:MAG TPA: hypothetical protein VF614_18475 [Chthoniobacteraceae bacterium]|jgi:hypothetical protein